MTQGFGGFHFLLAVVKVLAVGSCWSCVQFLQSANCNENQKIKLIKNKSSLIGSWQ